jgi:hypothetical protein
MHGDSSEATPIWQPNLSRSAAIGCNHTTDQVVLMFPGTKHVGGWDAA